MIEVGLWIFSVCSIQVHTSRFLSLRMMDISLVVMA